MMFGVLLVVFALTAHSATLATNLPLSKPTPPASGYVRRPAAQFLAASGLGEVDDNDLDEISGICASRVLKNTLYVHNDKNDGPKLYAISSIDGHFKATLHVHGAHNYDWEDVACGPCGVSGGNCIYIGEIGDHSGDGPRDIIYKVREPTSLPAHGDDVDVNVEAKLQFRWNHYSEQPDSETLMVDPHGDIYVVTKVDGGHGVVGRIPASAWTPGTPSPVLVSGTTTLLISSEKPDPSGGDISPDGREILIKSHTEVFHWYVEPGQSIMNALTAAPISISYHNERNGEAIAWASNGMGYYTLSEGHDQILYYYGRA